MDQRAGKMMRGVKGAQGVRAFSPPATKMTVADLLAVSKQFRSKQTNFINQNQTLHEAVKFLANNENSATLVVVNDDQKVVGLVTNHILLSRIAKMKSIKPTAAASPIAVDEWNTKVSEVAMPAREMLHVSPEDSLQDCRAVMALSGRGELPVLEGEKLLGTVSLTDIASLLHRKDSQLNPNPSAKSDYINVILPRMGMPVNTRLAETVSTDSKKALEDQWSYYLHCFAMSIPHPGKKETGGEDAYFVGTINDNGDGQIADGRVRETTGPADVLALGVADGVGSWFEKGISARRYSQELMHASLKAAQISFAKEHKIDPGEVLHAAWSTVLQKEIVGSSTACVLSLDPNAGELHACNLGGSGFLIIRDKKSDLESARQRGTLDGSLSRRVRDRESDLTPAGRRKGAHVSYRSPQQLHYFNCPFQLGFVGADLRKDITNDLDAAPSTPSPTAMSEKPLFETPDNAVRLRVPVLEGDLIVLATDGLFDNIEEDTLLDIVNAQPEVEAMTRQLVQKAYELSLDRMRDSPFARLAKENDFMWGGGMPDDITIIAARVMKRKTSVAGADIGAFLSEKHVR
ncbi:TPA: hypothetical protein N0F65_009464 [Lagenidium giganteum]|uniref:Protein phosphatase n=1 Tax=Lagenidium giganteum TaxID=4803 RepID=A0AAV2ZH58_9STRA|nr:TPA: hypothetical protein N0F65_009464 [Lagenidium giganteum]